MKDPALNPDLSLTLADLTRPDPTCPDLTYDLT